MDRSKNYRNAGRPMNVADATNAGFQVHPWIRSSGIQSRPQVDDQIEGQGATPPAPGQVGTTQIQDPRPRTPTFAKTNYGAPRYQGLPIRDKGGPVKASTKAPISRAGRTGGLSNYYGNLMRLGLERSGRQAIDPISGLSQTPREEEINALIQYLADKGEEVPGFSGFDQAMLMLRYFNAKKSGDPEALAQAAAEVQDFKSRLNAARGTPSPTAGQNPYVVNGKGPEMFVPSDGSAAQPITGGPQVRTFPQSGAILPANKTRELMQMAQNAFVAPQKVPGNLMEMASEVTQQSRPKTAELMDRTIETPYGTASVTHGEKKRPAYFNMTDTYDPNFKKKAQGMREASEFVAVGDAPTPTSTTPPSLLNEAEKFRAVEEMPKTGEGYGFEAVTQTPEQFWQMEAKKIQEREKAEREAAAKRQHQSKLDKIMASGMPDAFSIH